MIVSPAAGLVVSAEPKLSWMMPGLGGLEPDDKRDWGMFLLEVTAHVGHLSYSPPCQLQPTMPVTAALTAPDPSSHQWV